MPVNWQRDGNRQEGRLGIKKRSRGAALSWDALWTVCRWWGRGGCQPGCPLRQEPLPSTPLTSSLTMLCPECVKGRRRHRSFLQLCFSNDKHCLQLPAAPDSIKVHVWVAVWVQFSLFCFCLFFFFNFYFWFILSICPPVVHAAVVTGNFPAPD